MAGLEPQTCAGRCPRASGPAAWASAAVPDVAARSKCVCRISAVPTPADRRSSTKNSQSPNPDPP